MTSVTFFICLADARRHRSCLTLPLHAAGGNAENDSLKPR
jgi:hypothetical protein